MTEEPQNVRSLIRGAAFIAFALNPPKLQLAARR